MNSFEKMKRKKQFTDNKNIDDSPKKPANINAFNFDGVRKDAVNRDAIRRRRIFIEPKDSESMIAVSAYKSLRTSVLKELNHINSNAFMVTGPVKGVGKTSTSINLAINIARLQNKTALLVDLDLRHPSVHKYLGIKPELGIGDVLTGHAKLEDVILDTGINDFFLLPGKKKYEYSSELLSSNVMHNLLTTIKHLDEDTVIIFDMPPILGCDDVPAISPYIDACLMVIEEGATKLNELEESVSRIKDTNIIGYVLNKSADTAAAKYYY